MKLVSRILFALGSTLLCLSVAFSGSVPNNNHPKTFLGPTAKASITRPWNDTAAFSLLGEVGVHNFRLGGTLGFIIDPNQRIKFSADYLWQRINYSFFSGNTNQWVNQGSVSADYQYSCFGMIFKPEADFKAFLSHAPSKTLNTVTGSYINKQGFFTTFVNNRRIAGSNAWGIAPSLALHPWLGGKVGVEINYDKVIYDTVYVLGHNPIGFGGTFFANQAISTDIVVGASAAIRQPFNNYTASVNWINVPYFGSAAVLGLTATYTAGKYLLPTTYNASVSLDYYMDKPYTCSPKMDKQVARDFLAWTGTPAVYLPQVLAIPDQRVETVPITCPFTAPTFTGTIPLQTPPVGVSTLDVSSFFGGENLFFTVNTITAPIIPTNTVTINNLTGVLTITRVGTSTGVFSVTASNCNGTATSNAFTIVF